MSAESTYYQTLMNTPTIDAKLDGRIYPVKLPQNVVYPALSYMADVEVDGYLEICANPRAFYTFKNTLYASSYSDIIAITEAIRDVSKSMNWNIMEFSDIPFSTENSVYGRVLTIGFGSTI